MKKFSIFLLLLAILLSVAQSAVFAATSTASSSGSKWPVTRIGGADRIETANQICRAGWADADDDSTDSSSDGDTVSSSADTSSTDASSSDSAPADALPVCAIITNGYIFADALAGVPLAAAVDAPILLTNGTELRSSVTDELARIGAQRVYLLGGEMVISSDIEKKLNDYGWETVRLAGATRYETAVEIAKELEKISGKPADDIFIAYGYNYPDALSAGVIAGILGAPILYSSADGVPNAATAAYIKNCGDADIVILGGTSAISSAANENFAGLTQGTTKRISGSTRYATAIELCSQYIDLFSGKEVVLASGNDFPDALAGGSFAASLNAPMLLINSQLSTLGLYEMINSISPEKVYILGGTSAVSDSIVSAALSVTTTTQPTTTTTTAYVPVPSEPGDHIQREITIKSDTAAIYSDKSSSSSVIATVSKGTVFTAIDEGPDDKDQYTWFQVKINGRTGWICRTEVTISNTYVTIAQKTFSSADKAVIYLSPSCQGSNAYATGRTTEQKEMEAVAKIIKQILDKEYDCVTFIATSSIEINDRPAEALSYGADIYVAIHSNATGTSKEGYGASSYYFPACAQSKQLSQNLVYELNQIAPCKTTLSQQVINGMNAFYGIGYSEVRGPSDVGLIAILAETEFHDNAVGSDWIQSHHEEIARAYVNALVKTFNIPEK